MTYWTSANCSGCMHQLGRPVAGADCHFVRTVWCFGAVGQAAIPRKGVNARPPSAFPGSSPISMVRARRRLLSVIVAVTFSAACCSSTPNGVVDVVVLPSVVLVPARSWFGDHHPVTNQARRLQRLAAINLSGNRAEGGVELLNAADGADLRKLRGQFVVLHGVGGILVLKLRHQQRQKAALKIGSVTSRQGVRTRRTLGITNAEFVGSFTFTAMDMHVSFTGRVRF